MSENKLSQSNWNLYWRVTDSAGLMVYLADYKGKRMIWEASLPYVTIDHQQQNLEVEEDATEAHGPYWMPLGLRSLVGEVRVNQFRGGFELAADFETGPYRYTQMWRFHEDGRVAPLLTIYGYGVHDGHTYHPHWRFDFDIDGANNDAVEHFEDGHWHRLSEEGWFPFASEADPTGAVWRQVDFGSGAQVSIRPHHWEDAELYALRYTEGDWPPFTPKNAAGSEPFPAAYVGDRPLDGQDVTLWYVAHVHYDAAFPFTAGPWLRCSV
jgi:hypothetical protein